MNGFAPSFSALGCGGVIHVVLRDEFVQDGLVPQAETGKYFTDDIERSAHPASHASDA
jgi:hypothetical protein